jgi:hypothetical protein
MTTTRRLAAILAADVAGYSTNVALWPIALESDVRFHVRDQAQS